MPIYDKQGRRISSKWKSKKGSKTKKGKAVISTNALKHGFYSAGLAFCEKCPYLDKEDRENCPRYRTFVESVSGLGRCDFEREDLQKLYVQFNQDFELLDSDKTILKEMLYSLIGLKRSRRYLGRRGLIQKQKIKDDKSGKVYDTFSLNRVKKDMYYAEKNIREWLEQLKIARSQRDSGTQGLDLSLEIMKEGKLKKRIKL